jgi:hypothetical protein
LLPEDTKDSKTLKTGISVRWEIFTTGGRNGWVLIFVLKYFLLELLVPFAAFPIAF